MIPRGWSESLVSDFVVSCESGASFECEDAPATNGAPGVLKLSCFRNGRFNPHENKAVSAVLRHRLKARVHAGDLLFSRSNSPELVGASVFLEHDHPNLFLPDKIWRLKVRPESAASARWFGYVLSSPNFQRRLQSIASGTSGSMKNISQAGFGQLSFLKPPPAEQHKIAQVLGSWDDALQTLERLIDAKARCLRALMQQLLFGKRRLTGRKTRWAVRALRELIEPITRKVPKPSGAFLAAGIRSHGKGVFLKPAFEPDDIALDELFEIKTGDLIVNITFAWEGAAAIVPPTADGALVSHRFPTFRVRESAAAPSFLRHYILSERFVFDCGLASPGGAGRNRVLSKSGFLAIKLVVPEATEQKAIGDILDVAAAELRLLRQQHAALATQKRGLMQLLLTGRKRVRV